MWVLNQATFWIFSKYYSQQNGQQCRSLKFNGFKSWSFFRITHLDKGCSHLSRQSCRRKVTKYWSLRRPCSWTHNSSSSAICISNRVDPGPYKTGWEIVVGQPLWTRFLSRPWHQCTDLLSNTRPKSISDSRVLPFSCLPFCHRHFESQFTFSTYLWVNCLLDWHLW